MGSFERISLFFLTGWRPLSLVSCLEYNGTWLVELFSHNSFHFCIMNCHSFSKKRKGKYNTNHLLEWNQSKHHFFQDKLSLPDWSCYLHLIKFHLVAILLVHLPEFDFSEMQPEIQKEFCKVTNSNGLSLPQSEIKSIIKETRDELSDEFEAPFVRKFSNAYSVFVATVQCYISAQMQILLINLLSVSQRKYQENFM